MFLVLLVLSCLPCAVPGRRVNDLSGKLPSSNVAKFKSDDRKNALATMMFASHPSITNIHGSRSVVRNRHPVAIAHNHVSHPVIRNRHPVAKLPWDMRAEDGDTAVQGRSTESLETLERQLVEQWRMLLAEDDGDTTVLDRPTESPAVEQMRQMLERQLQQQFGGGGGNEGGRNGGGGGSGGGEGNGGDFGETTLELLESGEATTVLDRWISHARVFQFALDVANPTGLEEIHRSQLLAMEALKDWKPSAKIKKGKQLIFGLRDSDGEVVALAGAEVRGKLLRRPTLQVQHVLVVPYQVGKGGADLKERVVEGFDALSEEIDMPLDLSPARENGDLE